MNPLVTPTTEEAVVGSGAVGPADTAGEGARSLGRARVWTLATKEEDKDVGKEGIGAGCAAPLRLFEAAPQRKNWGKKTLIWRELDRRGLGLGGNFLLAGVPGLLRRRSDSSLLVRSWALPRPVQSG